MATQLQRSAGYVCRLCRSQQLRSNDLRPFLIFSNHPLVHNQKYVTQRRQASTQTLPKRSTRSVKSIPLKPSIQKNLPAAKPAQTTIASKDIINTDTNPSPPLIDAADAYKSIKKIRAEIIVLATSNEINQLKVLELLEQAYQISNILIFGQTAAPEEQAVEGENDVSLLSDLDEPSGPVNKPEPTKSTGIHLPLTHREAMAAELCQIVYDLLKIPTVIIDEDVLPIYVRIICQLGKPEYLPEMFFLYANKPVPVKGTKPVKYKNPNPNRPNQAIPQELSDVALDTAILARDLPLAISIIDTTVATRAFRLNKFIRKATMPITLCGVFPLSVYAAADWVSKWQNTMDPSQAKMFAMMGGAAYIGTFGIIGFVALTTWNDHHDRVRWVPGTPLRWRWLKEEERLYFDRVAMAWGFQNTRRRGEETGEEWEALRYELGLRSFVLDQSNLLEGMM